MNKLWYKSKTLWVNFVTILAIVIFGVETIPPEYIGAILAAINMILRLITKEPITWTNGNG